MEYQAHRNAHLQKKKEGEEVTQEQVAIQEKGWKGQEQCDSQAGWKKISKKQSQHSQIQDHRRQ